MMSYLMTFLAGGILGGIFGVFTMCAMVSAGQADDRENLIEEIADVSVCMTALQDIAPLSDVGEIISQKAQRWEERINDGES